LAPKKLGTIQTYDYEQYIQRILTARNNAFLQKYAKQPKLKVSQENIKISFQQSWHKKVLIAIAYRYSHTLH
jgi:hypothetical protein